MVESSATSFLTVRQLVGAERLDRLRDQDIGQKHKRERRLLAVLDEGRGLDGIVHSLGSEFGCAFVVTDLAGGLHAIGGPALAVPAILNCIEAADLAENVGIGMARATAEGAVGQFALVWHRHQPTGWIGWIVNSTATARAGIGILQEVAPVVGLELGARLELETRRHQEVGRLMELVMAGVANPVVLKDQLAMAGMDGTVIASAWRPETGERLREWRETKVHGETALGHLVLTDSTAPVGDFAEAHALAVGVGSPVEQAGLATSLREARSALALCRDAQLVSTWRELASIEALLEQQPPERMLSFARQLIAPLLPEDDSPSDVMISTLRTFLEEEGRVDSAAARLQIHPNSLRNRLHKVQKLTGRDPFRFHDRTALYIGLWAWERYLGPGGPFEMTSPGLATAY